MTEDCMKLIWTEVRGSTSLMLSFSLDRSKIAINKYIKSREFNIHNVAEICFSLQQNRDTNIYYIIMSRKHTLAKDLIVELHVVCKTPEFNEQFLCTEEWGENITMGWGGVGIEHFHILINIKVSKANINMKLYEDEEFTDFKLSTDEGSLPVHKAHLAVNSDVFKMMLSREWKETSEGHVQIKGVSFQTLKDLKQYIYLGTLPDNGLLPLLLLARYYLMDHLKAECLMKISQTVTSENLYEIMEYSFLNNIPDLMFNVMETMSKHIVKGAHEVMIKNQKNCEQAKEKNTTSNNEEAEEKTEEDNNSNNDE